MLTEVVYLLSCNREVTWIFGKRPCLYQSDGSPSVVTSLAGACCEVLCGITAFVWNKLSLLCFPTSLRSVQTKTTTTKNIRTCNNYDQVDGVAMRSPLGSVLANIFVSF